MNDPFQDLRKALDEYTAGAVLQAIQDKHRRNFVKIAVHPSQHEVIRQAVCNIDPLMESAVLSRSIVKPGTAIFMDTSILEQSFIPGTWDFGDK